MKYISLTTLLLAAIFSFCACESDDSNIIIEPPTPIKTIAIDSTALAEAETIPADNTDGDYDDYVEHSDFDYSVTITYNGNSVTTSGDDDEVTITASGADVTVRSSTKRVEYILKGYTGDGSFKIYSGNKFKIVLDGANITNPTGPAINNQCGKYMYVVLNGSNYLSDGSSYSAAVGSEDQKGTFFSEGQIVFSGTGSLSVFANCKNGIASDDYIRIRPGVRIYVNNTASNGIKSKDGVFINGGVINIEVSANAAKGINSESYVEVKGGRTTIITGGASQVAGIDTSSCAAIKCDSMLTLTGGEINLKSTGEGGKGINADEEIIISGGTLNVVTTGTKVLSSPKGIKTDTNFTMSAGSLYTYSANSSPLDVAGTLTVKDGYTTYNNTSNLVTIQY